MKTLSTLTLTLRAAGMLAVCLLAAGLGFYVFDDAEPVGAHHRRAR